MIYSQRDRYPWKRSAFTRGRGNFYQSIPWHLSNLSHQADHSSGLRPSISVTLQAAAEEVGRQTALPHTDILDIIPTHRLLLVPILGVFLSKAWLFCSWFFFFFTEKNKPGWNVPFFMHSCITAVSFSNLYSVLYLNERLSFGVIPINQESHKQSDDTTSLNESHLPTRWGHEAK